MCFVLVEVEMSLVGCKLIRFSCMHSKILVVKIKEGKLIIKQAAVLGLLLKLDGIDCVANYIFIYNK